VGRKAGALLGAVVAVLLAVPMAPGSAAASGSGTPGQPGYWMVNAAGEVTAFGGAARFAALGSSAPVVAVTATPSRRGYWLAAADGSVRGFGDARFFGSMAGRRLRAPIVSMASTRDGRGYWLLGADGGVFTFGDARFLGTATPMTSTRMTAIAADLATGGYWILADSGALFGFDAPYLGSVGALRPGARMVALSTTPDGLGYRLVAADGEVFAFGTARYFGSELLAPLAAPITGVADSPDEGGYWLVAADGGVFSFGDAPYRGSAAGGPPGPPVVGLAWGPGVGSGVGPIDPYPPGATGFDISWPQCGGSYPSGAFRVAVVGATGGHAFSANPCLGSEAQWASSRLSLYLNVNSPSGSDPSSWMRGPAGRCGSGDLSCQGYNYGYNSAAWAQSTAAANGARALTWWLDVETGNYWSSDTAANAAVIQGAIDALHAGGATAAVYSTSYQWHEIAGNFAPRVPAWVATGGASDPAAYCSAGSFTGGPVWLVQYGPGPYDDDYAC